jgi:hypothetical protein
MVFDRVAAALQRLYIVVGALSLLLATIQETCCGVKHGDVPVVLGIELRGDGLYCYASEATRNCLW